MTTTNSPAGNPTDGGPAFPQPENMDGTYADPTTCKQFVPYRGMSIRDYFAAKAMTGMLASDAHQDVILETLMVTDDDRLKRAEFAYKIADAMLKAREAKR